MNPRLLLFLKFSIILPISLLLFLSLISVSFYDPTFFHPLSPEEGVQNWVGFLGALLGGTLVELFGPSSFLIPWFLWKLSDSSDRLIQKFSIGYYAFVLLLSLSMGQALWGASEFVELTDSTFLQFPGYMGILGSQWVLKTFPYFMATVFVGGIIIFCTFKLFETLPIPLIQSLSSTLFKIGILFSSYIIKQLWKKWILGTSFWLWKWFARYQKTSSSQSLSSTFLNPRILFLSSSIKQLWEKQILGTFFLLWEWFVRTQKTSAPPPSLPPEHPSSNETNKIQDPPS